MVVGKEVVVEVLYGGLRSIPVADWPSAEPGAVVPLQSSATSRAACYISVIGVVGDEVSFVLVGAPEKPRFLAQDSTRGYTSDPARALRGEPEPISEVWQAALTESAELKAEHAWNRIESRLSQLPFAMRLRLCLEVASYRGQRVGGEVYRIRRMKDQGRAMGMLKQLERRVHRR